MSDLRFSDFAQKCGVSPLRMVQRGENRTSSHLLAIGGPIKGELPEKMAKKQGTSILALFGDFGDSSENGVQS